MPFDHQELADYIELHHLTGATAEYLLRAAEGPSRDIGPTYHSSLRGEYQSQKMGWSIAVESRTGEFAYALELEWDSTVLAYYEQPPSVEVDVIKKNGVPLTHLYTPDFLVLRKDGVDVVEVKPGERLKELAIQRPHDWEFAESQYVYKSAKRSFAKIGLSHLVVNSDQLDRVRSSNLHFLMHTRRHFNGPDLARKCLSALERNPVVSIRELGSILGLVDLSPIAYLLSCRALHTDLILTRAWSRGTLSSSAKHASPLSTTPERWLLYRERLYQRRGTWKGG